MAIVLLVDPSQTIRRVVEMVFKGSGHDVVAATSTTKGQQALVRYQPSVAVINYKLPDGSGIELCKLIKANPTTAHVQVVVLGGSSAPFDAGSAQAAGASATVMKPFKTAELLEPVQELLEAGDETVQTHPSQPAGASQTPAPAPPAAPQAPPPPVQAPAQAAPPESSPRTAAPRPQAAAAERPRYAPPGQSATASGARVPAAVPRPSAPPPAPQAPPVERRTAAYRGEPSPSELQAAQRDATRRVSLSETGAPQPRPIHVDSDTVRAIVEDLLPQIALDTLQKMLADWLEARLRNYIHELVRQELARYQRQ